MNSKLIAMRFIRMRLGIVPMKPDSWWAAPARLAWASAKATIRRKEKRCRVFTIIALQKTLSQIVVMSLFRV